jgi:TonB family protein
MNDLPRFTLAAALLAATALGPLRAEAAGFVLIRNAGNAVGPTNAGAVKALLSGESKEWGKGVGFELVLWEGDGEAMEWLAQATFGVPGEALRTRIRTLANAGTVARPTTASNEADAIAQVGQKKGALAVVSDGAALPAAVAKLQLGGLSDTVVEFNESMTAPVMVSGPDIEYTQQAIDRGIEGVMTVKCVITSDGGVRSCKAVKTLPLMEGPVLSAIARRKYKPAQMGGKAVDVNYTFNIKLQVPQ